MKRAVYGAITRGRWKSYRLPEDMTEKSFLDVGCWSGGFVREAVERGSIWAKGIDSVYDSDWSTHRGKCRGKVDFEVLNVFSDRFMEVLPPFHVVLCSGVLYHVSDPVGLLRRLRVKTVDLCVLETVIYTNFDGEEFDPLLMYCPADSLDGNPSNWFLPNWAFLREITKEVGFEIVESFPSGGSRLCLHLKPVQKVSEKSLPRRKEYMNL